MARSQEKRNATLLALTSSALLLPAYQGALADAQPEFTEMGMRYSKYDEDDILGSKAFGGGGKRYDIDVAQFHLLAPVAVAGCTFDLVELEEGALCFPVERYIRGAKQATAC